MSVRGRVYYVGMIATDEYGRRIGENAFSGAAARKMLTVAEAVRSAGHRSIIVSLPPVYARARHLLYPSVVTVEKRVPIAFLPSARSPFLRKPLAATFLTGFASCKVSSKDVVILYNHAVEYLPALLVLRLRGIKVVQDIEDAPTPEEGGLRGLLNRIGFAVTRRLTHPTKIVVAEHVARALDLQDYIVIRGVATQTGRSQTISDRKWGDLRHKGELRLHFGGTLIAQTGVDLFCEALEILAQRSDHSRRPISFTVTGRGELGKIRRLQQSIRGGSVVSLEVHEGLKAEEYTAIISTCHASLSLKRPDSSMSNTTFPSKVIEITAAGLALVSTRLGDVEDIFDDGSAFFIPEYTPLALAEVIVNMSENPARVQAVAKAGYDLCNRVFSARAIGLELSKVV